MNLKTRLIIVLLLLALLPMLALGLMGLKVQRDALENEQRKNLAVTANLTLHHIQAVMRERRGDIAVLQDSFNIRQNLPVLQAHLDAPESSAFRQATAELDSQLGTVRDVYNYDNVLLLDAQGRLAYATDISLEGQALGQALPAPLDKLFGAATKAIYVSSVHTDTTLEIDHLHFWIAAPIHDLGGNLIGSIMLQIDMESLYSHLRDIAGLGESGEILIGMKSGSDIQFISPTRVDIEGGGFRTTPFDGLSAMPMRQALKGNSGQGVSVDYRGQKVIAAWLPVPDTDWGLVVKIDTDEAFAPVAGLQRLGLLAMLITGVIGFAFALSVAQAITVPLRKMREASETFGRGNLEHRVGLQGSDDEIGQLSTALDEMARRLDVARQLQQRLTAVLDATPDLVGILDLDGHFTYINEGGRKMLALEPGADVAGLHCSQFYSKAEGKRIEKEAIPAALRDGIWQGETRLQGNDGKQVQVSQILLSHKGKDGSVDSLSTIVRDIGDIRKVESQNIEYESNLARINKDLKNQMRENEKITRELQKKVVADEETRQAMLLMLEDVNGSNIEIERAKREWESTFDAVAQPIFLHDNEGKIIRANRSYQQKSGVPMPKLIGSRFWKIFPKSAKPPGCCISIVADPIKGWDNKEVETPKGEFMVYMYPVMDEKGEYMYSIHFMQDVTERNQAMRVNLKNLALIRRNLQETIRAISHVVEARDPYTAGHQQRVAQLATAIAGEMGLDKNRIEGIRLGAEIHDIGKIQVPAEILSKPGKLTSAEYLIIKEHPNTGYTILKDIHFPWPVADIARQHHERMDGSGYPLGLRGDEISLDSRIVAVADVVEAMSSHRPYRTGLGLELALKEISGNRGRFYDEQVVDACLKLFKTNQFSFDEKTADTS